jgi:hypothetical protein
MKNIKYFIPTIGYLIAEKKYCDLTLSVKFKFYHYITTTIIGVACAIIFGTILK